MRGTAVKLTSLPCCSRGVDTALIGRSAKLEARGCVLVRHSDPVLPAKSNVSVSTVRYIQWQEEGAWLGFLEEFPDYWTQGDSLEELEENLRDLHGDLTSGEIPGVRRVAELTVGWEPLAIMRVNKRSHAGPQYAEY